MSKIELLLRSLLARDALSAVLTGAGFSVSREQDQCDDNVTVIIDVDDCQDPEILQAHQQRGVKIVVLAKDTDSLEMDQDQIAALSGILTYGLSADAFVRSLRLICSGQRVFPRNLVLRPKPQAPSSRTEHRSNGDYLSPREREVLAHLVAGHSNRAIAQHLGTAEATVKVHLKSLLRKINAGNRTQAAIWALSNLPDLPKWDATPCGFV
jgi:two-component system nitrate/nitrite response regulator NarL